MEALVGLQHNKKLPREMLVPLKEKLLEWQILQLTIKEVLREDGPMDSSP
jgi:hypothetical protein